MAYRVFVSSTFTDLADHREAVQAAIHEAGAVDVSMESFGARDERPKQACVRIIRQECDAFVGIYAHRYGFVPKGRKKSILESEYDAAAPLPRLCYVIDDGVPWLPEFIDQGEAKTRLNRLKARLTAAYLCKKFNDKDDLAESVRRDLRDLFLQSALVRVDAQAPPASPPPARRRKGGWTPEDWNRFRDRIYESNRGLFLVHTLAPITKAGQSFETYIYLERHKSDDLSDVVLAEFFLGRGWNSRVFTVQKQGLPIGITATSDSGFLCICRVSFTDGDPILLHRYIDLGGHRGP